MLPVSQLPSLVVLAALPGLGRTRRERPSRLLPPRVPRPTLLKTAGRAPTEKAGEAPGEPISMSGAHATIVVAVVGISTPS